MTTYRKSFLKKPINEKSHLVNNNENTPYNISIRTLRKINLFKNPFHKLKVIMQASEFLLKEIKTFYRDNFINEKIELDAEETISIFLYMTSQCNIPELISHCRFIENFASANTLNSIFGYYFVTLQACLTQIEYIYDQQFEKNNNYEIRNIINHDSLKSCIDYFI